MHVYLHWIATDETERRRAKPFCRESRLRRPPFHPHQTRRRSLCRSSPLLVVSTYDALRSFSLLPTRVGYLVPTRTDFRPHLSLCLSLYLSLSLLLPFSFSLPLSYAHFPNVPCRYGRPAPQPSLSRGTHTASKPRVILFQASFSQDAGGRLPAISSPSDSICRSVESFC